MKRNLIMLIAIFLALPFIADAQVEQGSLFLQGSNELSFNAGKLKYDFDGNKEDGFKFATFNLRHTMGYAVIDRLPIGIFLNVAMESYKDPDDSDDKSTVTELAVGPFVRYYFADLNNFMPFAEGSVGFGTYREKYGSDDPYKQGYFAFRLGAGFSYFINDVVGMDLHLGYQQETYTDKEAGESGNDTYKYKFGGVFGSMGIVISLGGGHHMQKGSSGQGRMDVRQ